MYRILRTRTCAHEPAHTNSRKLKGDTNLAVKFSGIFVRLICGKMTRNLAENKHLHPTVVPPSCGAATASKLVRHLFLVRVLDLG